MVIKTINTAKVPERDLQQAILAEAEQYIPYDMDDVNIDYQILGESEFSSEQMNILLVAVKKDCGGRIYGFNGHGWPQSQHYRCGHLCPAEYL